MLHLARVQDKTINTNDLNNANKDSANKETHVTHWNSYPVWP